MRKRHATIAFVCAVQYITVGLGTVWGLGAAHGVLWLLDHWSRAGWLSVLMLIVEFVHYLASRRLRTASPTTPWVCMALGSYAVWLMFVEAFLWYAGDESFVIGVLLMLPFLLAMSSLVRAHAWIGVAGSALFLTTSLAMLIRNGFSLTGGEGFFTGWVS